MGFCDRHQHVLSPLVCDVTSTLCYHPQLVLAALVWPGRALPPPPSPPLIDTGSITRTCSNCQKGTMDRVKALQEKAEGVLRPLWSGGVWSRPRAKRTWTDGRSIDRETERDPWMPCLAAA